MFPVSCVMFYKDSFLICCNTSNHYNIFETVVRWRHNRKLISPAFNLRMLNSFVPIFAEQSLILCKKLETMVDKGIFDAQPYLALCLLDMVCGKTEFSFYTTQNLRFVDCRNYHGY